MHVANATKKYAQLAMHYPIGRGRGATIQTLPAKFCRRKSTRIREAIDHFFVQGHPLYLLARKVRLVCESRRHCRLCPNDIVCSFSADDFIDIYRAIRARPSPRPNLDAEVTQWARRARTQSPTTVCRVIATFPETRSAVALALRAPRPPVILKTGPVVLIYDLVASGHIDLGLVSEAWLNTARLAHESLCGPDLTVAAIEAFAGFGAWVRYLNGEAPLSSVPTPLRRRITVCAAFLCTPAFTSLPVIPPEVGAIILKFLV